MPKPSDPFTIDGRRLRVERVRLDWSQERLARAMSVHQTTVARWENTAVITRAQAQRLADLLGVKTAKLIDRRRCVWCGKPQTANGDPLVELAADVWVHFIDCADAMAAHEHRGVVPWAAP